MRIAIDAMGGDKAPAEVVAGALAAVDLIDDNELVLIGNEDAVRPYLEEASGWEKKLTLVHAPESVDMDEAPVEALRKKRKSSIAVMAKMAAAGEVDVIMSAGNTGACVAAAQLRMRLLPGVIRPGIVVVFPTFAGPVTMCDVGANVAAKPSHLYQYAIMASVYARQVVGIAEPTVGLISVGEENAKGNELIKKTNQLLRDDPNLKFVGNVEGRDFIKRPADVIVCDGFVGNVILKLTEGLAEGLFKAIGREIGRLKPELIPHFEPVIKSLYATHDYSEYGGAPLLGVDGNCIICHGSSNARTIKNAILVACKMVRSGVNAQIAQEIGNMSVTEE
ncbi:MAG: phosphate acyltransferase PlsX [Sedimentisphaerales bacterium]|nr:phosphate acyltransferase PlsX [Sedimentisphaerales bacterium]